MTRNLIINNKILIVLNCWQIWLFCYALKFDIGKRQINLHYKQDQSIHYCSLSF